MRLRTEIDASDIDQITTSEIIEIIGNNCDEDVIIEELFSLGHGQELVEQKAKEELELLKSEFFTALFGTAIGKQFIQEYKLKL